MVWTWRKKQSKLFVGSRMETTTSAPHVVVVSFPTQGHLNPLLKLAKFLHSSAFYITYVISDRNLRRLSRSGDPFWASAGFPRFRVESIPDGVPPPPPGHEDSSPDITELCVSVRDTCLAPFRDLMVRLRRVTDAPPVTCIVSDGGMGFTVDEDFGVPVILFFAHSGCGFWSYFHFGELLRRGFSPLEDERLLKSGYLETPVDWIAGLENIRLCDLPSFARTTDADDVMFHHMMNRVGRDAPRAGSGIILNTFYGLEGPVLAGIRSRFSGLYAIGPLSSLPAAPPPVSASLWKEDGECVRWLDAQAASSVLYVNFGSITVLTTAQLEEFAWGLAASEQVFLWVVRPDLVAGEAATLPAEFAAEVEGRGLLVEWCNQEAVLGHPATAAFLSHCGWNSTLESVSAGVPMICWPFFAEQQTNCRYLCSKWGMGMEIGRTVRREEVEKCIRAVMAGDEGKEMRRRAKEWKEKARKAVSDGGSSLADLERLVEDLRKMVNSAR